MFDTFRPGPYYEDFVVGATVPAPPAVTLSAADNTVYRAITGDQHLLAADVTAYAEVSGSRGRLANPGLVMQYSIGQTTMATRQAIANLYYRSVRFLRPVELGETLRTTTTVLGLKDSVPKGGQHRGKVWLGIRTSSAGEPVIEYERCALVRGRVPGLGRNDDIPGPDARTPIAAVLDAVPAWDLAALPGVSWEVGESRRDPLCDHVDLAAPLARMTFNQAAIHRDCTVTADGRRLVYGGHVQGLAQASLTRMLPGLAIVLAWDGCDHLGPAHDHDLLEFTHTLLERAAVGSGEVLRFEVVGARPDRNGAAEAVLRWTPIVWAAPGNRRSPSV